MKTHFKYVRELFLFSLPVVAGSVSQVFFGIGDVLVAGRYSTLVLAALGVAAAIFFPFLLVGLGIMSATSPIKARRLGAGECVKLVPSSSLLLSIILGIILSSFLLFATHFLVPLFGYEPQFLHLIQIYLYITALSIIPALMFKALTENLLALSHTVVPNLLIFLFNFFNVAANILLMFVFDYGIAGAAIATLLSRSLMALFLLAYSRHKCVWEFRICKDTIVSIVKVGLPAGFSFLVVGGVFSLVAVLAGRMPLVAAASNNILLNISSLTFVIPMAFANVTAVKVGYYYGVNDFAMVRNYIKAAMILACSVALFSATIFWLFPTGVFSLFTDQPKVISYGAAALFYIGLYQLPDALQEVFSGALRGLGKTVIPLYSCIFSIWGVGLPVGCFLAYGLDMEVAGLWAGLAIGLMTVSVCHGLYLKRQLK
ncbi:MAG: MATE family efflux transporter [Lentisphaeria bacterium]|nr:MATE family efflux transporter [Lentisphaeria bacterium]